MAEANAPTGTEGTEPSGEGQEPDYKALYEQEKANSRKWEGRAKVNKSAADELAKAQEAGKTAEEKIADLTKRLDEKEKAEKRTKLAAAVAEKKGVPADMLVGDTEEEMEKWADKLLAYSKKSPAAQSANPGKFDRGDSGTGSPKDDFDKFMNEYFG